MVVEVDGYIYIYDGLISSCICVYIITHLNGIDQAANSIVSQLRKNKYR